MNTEGVADVRDMLATVPDTDRAIVIFAVNDDGDVCFRRVGLSPLAAARVLRAMAEEIEAQELGKPEDATLQ